MSLPTSPGLGGVRGDGSTADSQGDAANDGVEHAGGGIDRTPARASVAIATGFAFLGALTMVTPALVAVGLFGTLLVGLGAIHGSRTYVGYGALVILLGVLIGGFQGAPPEPLLVSTLLAVLAWDAGRYGITIGEQLGPDAKTLRIELTHVTLNTLVGTAGTGLGYAAYRVMAGGQPVAALGLLLVGAVVLVVTLR
ncbi:putative membrane protein [Halorhabdus sp. SVX81]|uniref:DUF7519 family protein n=1 Tax=Halorhabdus sp. SVX81 TaxID=2978283 RepID=UPI0023D97E2E|nr:hypothetical protein [Halorhabdus sp. SVX81]WEL16623.1 putative membrane protein [Halorhabdus sp. SVX81]